MKSISLMNTISNLGKNYRLWFTVSLILFCRECDDVMYYYIVDVEFELEIFRIRKFRR